MKNKSIRTLVVCALVASGIGSTAYAAPSWNAANDFNASANPTGAWSYGWTSTLGGAFAAFGDNPNFYGVNWWAGGGSGALVFHNPTSYALELSGTVYAEPGVLVAHPGSQGELAVVRWTAQSSGSYTVNAGFYGISKSGETTTTDVHVLKNGVSSFDGLVEGHWAIENVRVGPTVLNFSLNAGDHVDFVVGYGSNATYYYDSTRLDATITAVPEPETYALLLAGLGLVGAIARRRKAAQA
jgi:hypothetical protein